MGHLFFFFKKSYWGCADGRDGAGQAQAADGGGRLARPLP